MNNSIYFLRHAKTIVDQNIPIDKWIISEKGKEKTREIVNSGCFDDIEIVIASEEMKAIQTANFVSERLGKKLITSSDFNELRRFGGYIEGQQEYEKQVKMIFEKGHSKIKEWEIAKSALTRIKAGVEQLDKKYSNKKILVVSHGIILSLFFGYLLGISKKEYFQRWKRMKFCGWGVIRNKKIIKDIIS